MNQVTTNQLTKKRKKKGFTLIELIAVIAIIGILAAVLVPKVLGYMNDAKESKVIAQCRTIVMAQETILAKEPTKSPTDYATVTSVKDRVTAAYADYADVSNLDMLPSNATIENCKKVTNGAKPTMTGGKWTGEVTGGTTTT